MGPPPPQSWPEPQRVKHKFNSASAADKTKIQSSAKEAWTKFNFKISRSRQNKNLNQKMQG
jgi:hypothetical protein